MKAIKPVGFERDKQIAKLRGDKCYPCFAYSTNITSAMELWQEMRDAGAQPSLSVVQDFVACEAWINYGQEDHDLISNLDNDKSDKSTEAAAISECYFNWKSRL